MTQSSTGSPTSDAVGGDLQRAMACQCAQASAHQTQDAPHVSWCPQELQFVFSLEAIARQMPLHQYPNMQIIQLLPSLFAGWLWYVIACVPGKHGRWSWGLAVEADREPWPESE